MDNLGNTLLVAGNPSKWGISSDNEVVARVNGVDIPLYYSPYSFDGKKPVVDSYLGMKDGPLAAELTGPNEITVIYKGGYYLSWGEATHIFIEKYNASTGVAESRYNFNTKNFDQIVPGDTFWTNGTQRGDYRAEYISETYPLYSTELPKGYNNAYYEALEDFSFILNPLSVDPSSASKVPSNQSNTGTQARVDSLTGQSKTKDIFAFSTPPEFGLSVDKITNFSAKDKDSIQFSLSAFGVTTGRFAIAKKPKKLATLLSSDANFIYNQRSGELIFNANGSEAGFGDNGGVFAQLVGCPKLLASSVSFV